MTLIKKISVITAVACGALIVHSNAFAQRAGQSMTVRTGEVTGLQAVDLNDGNAIKGALVGGAFGSALTRSSKSSGRRDRNTAIGAVIGASAAASKTRPGRIYTVTMIDGSAVRVATEQTEMRVGDCVYVEETGSGTNIRRAHATACDPASQQVMQDSAMVGEMKEEAAECAAAKQELVDAADDAAVDRALRKVQLLCFD
jgi:hypothetical protein